MKSGHQSTVFSIKNSLNIGGLRMDFDSPKVMGILNVTPDSFFDGNKYGDEKAIILKAGAMLDEGASLIDIGGYSTRPGAADISPAEELGRVIPAVRSIIKEFPHAVLSIDTFRSEVAKASVEEGALMVNDVSGGNLDKRMYQTIAELKVPYVLMHMRGTPENMVNLNEYENVTLEVIADLQKKISVLSEMGVNDIIVDPGFGFAKNIKQNFEMLSKLDRFKVLDKPILTGLSRKSMVWKTLGVTPAEALTGTTALHTIAVLKGVSILRVHDVKDAVEVIKVLKAYTYTD